MKTQKLKAEMISIKKNVRFRILKTSNKNFLVDTDQSLLWLFFPIMSWFVGVKVYDISVDESKKLLEQTMNKKKMPAGVLGLVILGSIILRHGANALTLNLPFWANIALLIVVIFVSLLTRFIMSIKSNTQDFQSIISNNQMIVMKIRNFTFFNILRLIFLIVLVCYALFLSIGIFILTSNIICLFILYTFVICMTGLNTMSVHGKCILVF